MTARSSSVSIALLGLMLAGCTFLVDRSNEQCQTDADCTRFGMHPFCREHLCVASGLGPAGCFFGAPQAPTQFANACSSAACLPFDDCARTGECVRDGGGADELAEPADLGSPPGRIDPI